MSNAGWDALAAELRATPPRGMAQLSPPQLEHLAGAVADARRRQRAELATASEQALSHIPGLLRGPVRRVFG